MNAAAAVDLVYREARLIDEKRFDEWMLKQNRSSHKS